MADRKNNVRDLFDLTGRVAVITGGAGLLGTKHAEAVAELGGIPCIVDISLVRAEKVVAKLKSTYACQAYAFEVDITAKQSVLHLQGHVLDLLGRVDILVNNAANNPKVENGLGEKKLSRFENFPLDVWNADIAVGLTGAFLCSQVFGEQMASANKGVILNIASDLGLIAPDQRIYREHSETADTQDVKPVTYSVVKSGLIGLTRYLSTYWAHRGVRANSLAPGGVEAGQNKDFVDRLTNLIPMGRMAHDDEYKAAVAFMISDASSYMNGATISIDGGRTAW